MWWSQSCAGCGAGGTSPCSTCRASARPAGALVVPGGLDALRAPYEYEGAVREVLLAAKYRGDRTGLRWLASAAADTVADLVEGAGSSVVVTWAPTTGSRRRRRGVDQGEVLARFVAADLGLDVSRRLRRLDRVAQTGRSGDERRHGPHFQGRGLDRRHVLVVDDVCTTGSTLGAAGRALRSTGAPGVVGLAVTAVVRTAGGGPELATEVAAANVLRPGSERRASSTVGRPRGGTAWT